MVQQPLEQHHGRQHYACDRFLRTSILTSASPEVVELLRPAVPSGGPGETRASASHDVIATRPRGTPGVDTTSSPVLPTRVTGVLQPPSRLVPLWAFVTISSGYHHARCANAVRARRGRRRASPGGRVTLPPPPRTHYWPHVYHDYSRGASRLRCAAPVCSCGTARVRLPRCDQCAAVPLTPLVSIHDTWTAVCVRGGGGSVTCTRAGTTPATASPHSVGTAGVMIPTADRDESPERDEVVMVAGAHQ